MAGQSSNKPKNSLSEWCWPSVPSLNNKAICDKTDHISHRSVSALRGSTSRSRATRSRTKCAGFLPRTWRCRQWRWKSHISTQGRNTRPGPVRSSAPRPELQACWVTRGRGARRGLGTERLRVRGFTFCPQILFMSTLSFTYTAKLPVASYIFSDNNLEVERAVCPHTEPTFLWGLVLKLSESVKSTLMGVDLCKHWNSIDF